MAPAVFEGSIKTPIISMEEGVVFNGTCEMPLKEGGGKKLEAESRRPEAEVRKPETEIRKPEAEVRRPEAEVKRREAEATHSLEKTFKVT